MAFVLIPDPSSKQLGMNGLNINGQDSISQPLLTDDYQLNMAYGYWQQDIHNKQARFELFFRKNPFKGEFTVFAGLEDCLHFIKNFKFSPTDLDYIRQKMPHSEEAFFDYLANFSCAQVTLEAIPEGTVVFPKIPLIIVEGPLAVCQFLETPLLNLVNFASLVTTNAARFRLAAGENIELLEFGLRRAQGPNGGLSASKYCYVGGFDSTSNLLAGKLFGIPVKGTMAHSFVTSFRDGPLHRSTLKNKHNQLVAVNLQEMANQKLNLLLNEFGENLSRDGINVGERNAFCAYAIAHPDALLALIDTYDTLRSGLVNFIAVALALNELGYRALGCRIDSGDLAYLSTEIRRWLQLVAERFHLEDWFAGMKIVASNDINEETIRSLNNQGHKCDAFGVGTHLVTCQKQPALGCVYKLVQLEQEAKIKLSEDIAKITIPGKKKAFRLYSKNDSPLVDLMTLVDEPDPVANQEILCRHPFEAGKRAKVIPCRVERLHRIYWQDNRIQQDLPTLAQICEHSHQSLSTLRSDHKRALNPTPYKVSLSAKLYEAFNEKWLSLAPIGQLT